MKTKNNQPKQKTKQPNKQTNKTKNKKQNERPPKIKKNTFGSVCLYLILFSFY